MFVDWVVEVFDCCLLLSGKGSFDVMCSKCMFEEVECVLVFDMLVINEWVV